MFNFSRNFYKNKSCTLLFERVFCNKIEVSKASSKATIITAAIKLYLEKCQKKDDLIFKEKQEFELGRRYLAKMMGMDPETFTQDDIDESIRYLFPSGLFNPDARPIMTDPSNIYPSKKLLECDSYGRPHNSFYYTARPSFYSMMLEGVYLFEKLKSLEDEANRGKVVQKKPIEMFNTKWLDQKQLSALCVEKLNTEHYNSWVSLMESILNHPFSAEAEEYLRKMRVPLDGYIDLTDWPKPKTDPETGRKYAESYGQKKWTLSEVRLYMPGEGRITINDKNLLEAVPLISNREAILFPLKFTDTIGKVDIIANVKESGPSNLSLSLRLAISRALSCFLPEEEILRMRLAGLLTQDDRYKERKQPAQKKARKKPVWRKR